jgi:DNA-binding CsgD family transcriptional regulator
MHLRSQDLAFGITLSFEPRDLPWGVVVVLQLTQALPLAWRQRAPGTVFCLVGLAFVADQLLCVEPHAAQYAGLVAMYATLAYGSGRLWVRCAVAASAVLGTVAVVAHLWVAPGQVPALALATGPAVMIGVPLLVGSAVQQQRHRAVRLDGLVGDLTSELATLRTPSPPARGGRPAVESPGPLTEPSAVGSLTTREREVLTLLLQGRSNPEIAQALFISRNTTKTHVAHILAKLGLKDRTQVLLYAQRHGLTDVGMTV